MKFSQNTDTPEFICMKTINNFENKLVRLRKKITITSCRVGASKGIDFHCHLT